MKRQARCATSHNESNRMEQEGKEVYDRQMIDKLEEEAALWLKLDRLLRRYLTPDSSTFN